MVRGFAQRTRGTDPFDEVVGKAYDHRLMRRLLTYLGPYRGRVLSACLLMALVALTNLASPWVVKLAVDQFIAQGNLGGLDRLCLLFVGISLVNWLANFGQIYLISAVGQRVVYDLRLQLFSHLQRLSHSFYDQAEVGRTMSRVQNDVNAISELLSSSMLSVLSDLLTIVGIVVAMLSLDWRLALLTFLVLPVMGAITVWWRLRARDAYREVRATIAGVNANLQENLSGVRVVQSFSREDRNLTHFRSVNREHLAANLQAGRLSALLFPAIELVAAVATALVIAIGGGMALADQLTAGTLIAFTLYISRFFDPIRDLSMRYSNLQSAMASSERIFELLDVPPEIEPPADGVALPRLSGAIAFDHVTFGYRAGPDILHNVDLQIRPGEVVAVVGPTGAGKSSLVALLPRFYDVRAGRVLVDGLDVRTVDLPALRGQIGIVPQDSFLFSGTVADNIRFGRLDATKAEVEAVARAVGAHAFISRLPAGYDTEVQERGVAFSTGQRQLICFARALLADPAILILDEATSSVDVETERAMQRALNVAMQGRTRLVIAHRLATVREADRIVVLEDGRIVEQGPHAALLDRGGLYARLYARGFLDRAEAERDPTPGPSPRRGGVP